MAQGSGHSGLCPAFCLKAALVVGATQHSRRRAPRRRRPVPRGETHSGLRDAAPFSRYRGRDPYGFTQDGKVTVSRPSRQAVFSAIGVPNVEAQRVEFGQLIPG